MIRAVDLFAGAGGTSTGLAQAAEALGANLELTAVNHWDIAVETHSRNHPWANHLCADLDALNPRKVVPGKLDLLVASPECTHHSTARGGRPINDQSRASAWCVVRWAEALLPRFVLVENVREFQSWGPLTMKGRPMKNRAGETFRAWVHALESLGYRVACRVLCAADYGDPTTRRRLFVLAWRGRGPAIWPEETHADGGAADLFGARQPWRAAREIIDWELEGLSIFARRKPLAAKTLARIAEGLRRFGGDAAEPWLRLLEGGEVPADASAVPAFMLGQQSGGAPRVVGQPVPTLATSGAVSLVEPFLVPGYGERPTQAPRTHSLDAPVPTLPCSDKFGLAQPFLVRYQGTGGAEPVTQPVPTITTRDRFGLVEPARMDIRFRMLAPHELAAAQGFPSDYEFTGTRTQVVKQIGNAVPVGIARALCAGLIGRCA